MYSRQFGLSLIELLIAISIIGILAAVLVANFSEARGQARDVERQSDLRALQSAIELYKNKYGRYPARCPSAHGSWSGQPGTSYACTNGSSQYIVGLAPEFIPTLPLDPVLNGNDSGYVYTVNTAGTVYKLMARRTVESETIGYGHPFQSCDRSPTGGQANNSTYLCDRVHSTGNNFNANLSPAHCTTGNEVFRTTYGVWGGFAEWSNDPENPNHSERLTEDVVCDIP